MAEPPEFDYPVVISPMQELAIVMHESYLAFLHAGFNEDQAMHIMLTVTEFATTSEEDEDDE